jgi:hypothetical protein
MRRRQEACWPQPLTWKEADPARNYHISGWFKSQSCSLTTKTASEPGPQQKRHTNMVLDNLFWRVGIDHRTGQSPAAAASDRVLTCNRQARRPAPPAAEPAALRIRAVSVPIDAAHARAPLPPKQVRCHATTAVRNHRAVYPTGAAWRGSPAVQPVLQLHSAKLVIFCTPLGAAQRRSPDNTVPRMPTNHTTQHTESAPSVAASCACCQGSLTVSHPHESISGFER